MPWTKVNEDLGSTWVAVDYASYTILEIWKYSEIHIVWKENGGKVVCFFNCRLGRIAVYKTKLWNTIKQLCGVPSEGRHDVVSTCVIWNWILKVNLDWNTFLHFMPNVKSAYVIIIPCHIFKMYTNNHKCLLTVYILCWMNKNLALFLCLQNKAESL